MASDQIVQVVSCLHGAVTIKGNLTFTFTETGATVSNRADAEIYVTGKKLVTVDTSGSLSGIDAASYAAIVKGVEDSLVVTGKQVSDDSTVTITITKAMFITNSGTINHSSEGGASLDWEATSSNGTLSPIVFS